MVQELTRLPDWRARLQAEIEAQRHAPFAWGARDCALGLAGGVVQALTGVDLRRGWRGKYKTARGAMKALRAAGFESLGDAVASMLPEIHPSQAHVGDLALVNEGEIGALAVFNGGVLVVLTVDGLGVRERSAAVRAFKVG